MTILAATMSTDLVAHKNRLEEMSKIRCFNCPKITFESFPQSRQKLSQDIESTHLNICNYFGFKFTVQWTKSLLIMSQLIALCV